jgi:hypothetical protein
MPITLDGTLGITTPALTVTGATVNTGGISTAGNLTFTSTGQRILGDFDSGTITNRVLFQATGVNQGTNISAIPNGTGSVVAWGGYASSSDPANTVFGRLRISLVDVRIDSTISGTGTYVPITAYTGGSERMRIDTSGNVGIGTSSPAHRLDVNGQLQAKSQFYLTDSSGGDILRITEIAARDVRLDTFNGTDFNGTLRIGGQLLSFETGTGGGISERMRIDSSGNVGIGTASPTFKLDVSGQNGRINNAPATTLTYFDAANAYGTTRIATDASGVGYIGTASNLPLAIYSGNTERIRITTTGAVGIGNSNPGALLHVTNNSNTYAGGILIGSAGVASGYISTTDNLYIKPNTGANTTSGAVYISNFSGTPQIALDASTGRILNAGNRPMVNQTGGLLQTVVKNFSYADQASTSGISNYNSALPTSAQGTQIYSVSFTPINSSSTLLFNFTGYFSTNTVQNLIVWLLEGTTTIAVAAPRYVTTGEAGWAHTVQVSKAANGTQTYSIRFGVQNGGTAYFTYYPQYSGATQSIFTIQELAG